MHKAAQAYFSTQINTTTQGQLLIMLYDGAIKFLTQAKTKIDEKDYAAKGVLISRALDIIAELDSSLNAERGGELATNLHNLYFYCNTRLLMANMRMDNTLVDEVIHILGELRSAYSQIVDGAPAAQPATVAGQSSQSGQAAQPGQSGQSTQAQLQAQSTAAATQQKHPAPAEDATSLRNPLAFRKPAPAAPTQPAPPPGSHAPTGQPGPAPASGGNGHDGKSAGQHLNVTTLRPQNLRAMAEPAPPAPAAETDAASGQHATPAGETETAPRAPANRAKLLGANLYKKMSAQS